MDTTDIDSVRALGDALHRAISSVIVGQEEVIDSLLVTLLCRGHILLEGPPGTAKTLLARAFARTLDLGFTRIQFTSDLMPGDVTGANVFNFQTNTFTLRRGPVFTDFLLADEINRTAPKTQSALLEAMQERAVTIDGHTHALSEGFIVVATQNPLDDEGTYPLPAAQLDRFLLKARVPYPDRSAERRIVTEGLSEEAMTTLSPVAGLDQIRAARATIDAVTMREAVVDYAVDLVRATRIHPDLATGASPRATALLTRAARARAALQGRDFVLPDDIKVLFERAIGHRIRLSPDAEMEGAELGEVLRRIEASVPAPRA